MKTCFTLPLIVAGLLVAGCSTPVPRQGTARDGITVDFQNPEDFRDVRESLGGSVDENALADLRAYIQEKGSAYLQPGQKLHVTFTDIDLAGDFPGSAGGHFDRVRLIKDIYIPRMVLSFELTDASGQVVKQGQRTLTDMNFQVAALRIGADQPYYHDKRLLDDWLRKEFKQAPPATPR